MGRCSARKEVPPSRQWYVEKPFGFADVLKLAEYFFVLCDAVLRVAEITSVLC